MWQRAFWAATGERAAKAFAATLLSTWAIGGGLLDLRGVDWGNSLGVAGGAAVLSLLFSVASSQIGPAGSPSLVADPAAAGVLEPPAPPLPDGHEPPSNMHRVGDESRSAGHRFNDGGPIPPVPPAAEERLHSRRDLPS